MRVEYTLDITARCPVDGKYDSYSCVVRSGKVIPVEKIIEAADSFRSRAIYQEDLTAELHRILAADVETVGQHSGVKTRCRVGAD